MGAPVGHLGAENGATVPATEIALAAPQYTLAIFHHGVPLSDEEELVPVRGAGYEPLRAFVYMRGKPRKRSPVADVQAYCSSSTRCEYRAPRKAGYADEITISLQDDSVAHLSAADDMVVISARTLGVETRSIVKVTMTIPGHMPVIRQIIFSKPRAQTP